MTKVQTALCNRTALFCYFPLAFFSKMCDNSVKHTSENGDGMEKEELLQRVFGYSSFRPGQEKLIDGVLSGQDVFGIMPTGGGKSMCYQLPALMLPGITLVISPLISLMRDQVMALKAAGVPAAFLNSTLTGPQMQAAYRNLLAGRYKIVYVAPERLDYPGFGGVVEKLNISFIAVDEAHCISQWGQDFRPSYLRIVQFIDSLPKRPVVGAFTATATRSVQEDVERILELRSPVREVTGFDRPNLYFEVIQPESKDKTLLRLLAGQKRKSGIIYCATRKKVESVCELLCDHGYAATRYHAGLSEAERSKNQEDFLYDRKTVMVATNAFGMGIDKSNVSFVIHYNMPKSIEAYYQEAGRAGRDGSPADCILLYSPGDVTTAKFLIFNSSAENEELTEEARQAVQTQDLARLESMTGYCKTQDCLRGYLLDYFGQPHEKTCSNCGNCQADYETQDLTREAQMILSCVVRARNRLGYCVGSTILSQTLHGGRAARVRELGLDTLPTYGLMSTLPSTQIREWIELLERAGYLETDPVHGGIDTTPKAASVLFSGEQVLTRVRRASHMEARPQKKAAAPRADEPLLAALKALRFRIAQEQGVPAYIVFSNATLLDMAAKQPCSMEELMDVSGVGHVKAERYGAAFLHEISRYTHTHKEEL